VASIELTVHNPSGLHARPAARFVQAAGRFRSVITVENLDREGSPAVDAKSILLLLTIGVGQGNRIRITALGEDAEQAVEALREAVESGLGETVET
jgi:phosphotransferase system HPr (HPr) family protein